MNGVGFWARDKMANAAPLAGWGAFGAINARGSFNILYADGEGVAYAPRPGFAASQGANASADIDVQRAEAYQLGYQDGVDAALAEQQVMAEAQTRLSEALEQIAPAAGGTLSTLLSSAVIRLVGQIVGEVPVDQALLLERCRAVAACIEEDDARPATLRVNPEDHVLVADADIHARIVADPSLSPGCVRLDTVDGWIEDGPDVRLARLKALLDDMEGRA
jgi:flagellar assembly protein FliH